MSLIDGLEADGAGPLGVLGQGEVVQQAGPAVGVATAGHAPGHRLAQANGAQQGLRHTHILQAGTGEV